MAYIVKASETGKIKLAPESVQEEILQNLTMIVSTPQFSVPLDRGFGLGQRFLDKPIETAKAILVAEVMDAIEQYEPRASIVSVNFELGQKAGSLIPIVEVDIP